jgi:hypothetical protein
LRKQRRKEEPVGRLELVIKAAKVREAQSSRAQSTEEPKPQKTSLSQDPRSAVALLKEIIAGKNRPP